MSGKENSLLSYCLLFIILPLHGENEQKCYKLTVNTKPQLEQEQQRRTFNLQIQTKKDIINSRKKARQYILQSST